MYACADHPFSRSTSLPFHPTGCEVSLNMRKTRTSLSAVEAAWLMAKTANEQDRAAFSKLFDFYGPRIKAFMMRSGFPSSAAEELAQETMLLVWKKASSFDVSRASVSTWIFTIARNLRIDRLRRENRPQVQSEPFDPSDQPDEPMTGEAIMMSSQRTERIRAALAMLSVEQAEVVRLSFFGDKAQTEIASELGIPLGTVKSRVRLALARLRQILDDLK